MSADGGDTESGSNTTDSTDTSSDNETNTENSDAGPGSREVAYRPLATEFDDANLSYAESDEERAPNYVVTPTGLRVNRLFAVGVLTEVEQLNSDTLRGRIVDPTGAFVTYAGQYQPEAQASLDGTDTPSFVALTGKARTFEPDDADRIFTSVRPESVSEVTADTRDRWTVSAAESTLDRIAVFAEALAADHRGDELRAALVEAGVDESLAAGIPRAIDHYGTTTAYLEAMRQCAVDALEIVADERDEVRPVEVAPDEGGAATLGSLPDIDVDLSSGEAAETTPDAEASPATADTEATTASTASSTADADSQSTTPTDEGPATGATAETTTANESTDEPSTADIGVEKPDSTPVSADSEETAGETAGEPAEATADAEAPTAGEMTESPAPDKTDDETETVDAEEPDMYQLDEEEREELESEYGTDFSSGNEVDPAGEADIDVPDADELAAEAESESEATATAEATSAEPETTESTAEPSTTQPPTAESATTESTDTTGTLGTFEDTVESDDSGESTVDETDEPTADDSGESTADDDSESTADTATTDETGSEAAVGDADGETQEAADIDLEDAAVELMGDLDDGDGADREAVVAEVADAHGVAESAVENAIDDALMSGRCYEPDDGTLKPI